MKKDWDEMGNQLTIPDSIQLREKGKQRSQRS